MRVVHLADAPDAALFAAAAELVKGSTRSEPLHRWSIDLIVTHLEELGARYSSAKCTAGTDHRSLSSAMPITRWCRAEIRVVQRGTAELCRC
eukprot:m.299320 g.299320  ORF g.299320 m.299320 type:complete len:92 (-) comp27234_c0_seq1:808-1083(-)